MYSSVSVNNPYQNKPFYRNGHFMEIRFLQHVILSYGLEDNVK